MSTSYFSEPDLVDIDSMSSTCSNFNSTRSNASYPSPLKRGKACAVCRAHKIKCDGVRPICGSCRRKPKTDTCEWDNSQSKSRIASLIETIRTLEARIFELEHPELVTPSVTLHYPYRRDEEEHLSHCSSPLDTQSRCPNPSFPMTNFSSDSYWDTATPTIANTGISSITSVNGESFAGGHMELEHALTAFPRQGARRC